MTRGPLPELPHFPGKTLIPESPVPVHIPEPNNIPVLQNQIDQHFNLMSTHMAKRPASHGPGILGFDETHHHHHQSSSLPQVAVPAESNLSNSSEKMKGRFDKSRETEVDNDFATNFEGNMSNGQEPDALSNHLNSVTQPSIINGVFEDLSIPTPQKLTPISLTQNLKPIADTLQAATGQPEQTQDELVSQEPSSTVSKDPGEPTFHTQSPGSGVNDEGVNYQALLDNISPSTSTAPTAENLSSISAAAHSSIANISTPSSTQNPIATLPIPAGLPPRPPPQEKPAIHPNYVPGEDIRSYHRPTAQNGNVPPSIASQPSNSYRPPQGYPYHNSVAPNGLPPPPLATFQQSMSQPSQAQSNSQTLEGHHGDEHERKTGRSGPQYVIEDERPRRPEVERLYDEFIREEAVYVSEGTWDRFPQGSRLFVG